MKGLRYRDEHFGRQKRNIKEFEQVSEISTTFLTFGRQNLVLQLDSSAQFLIC
jgi:hypothetical protein